ncbi:SPOR domain-containing protein [Oceanisphaera sp. IT1-181]|uniref:SPOR domain-containing protein n=1 Tax=Oceanisphaera sp. IT1-181 TaxID=3081199 RepID=UPI0029CA4EDF|nr:SPOR domain-containing protein [Oceanisphaera sp. IT1-181]
MATQFQQRLIGTVIIVAIGVIFLPDLLSGKKQLVPDEAVTIPLRPQLDAPLQAITPPPRPGTEAAGRAAEAAQQVAAAAEQLAAQQAAAQQAGLQQSAPQQAAPAQPVAEVWTIEQTQEAPPVAPKPAPQPQAVVQAPAPQPKPAPVPQPAPQPVTKPAPQPVAQPRLVAGQIQQIEPRVVTPQPQTQQAAPQAPAQPAGAAQGQFVVQLGAFRNAANVNALVQKLRAAGYNAQTTPSTPREGELNRVWVGPASKASLDQQLPALQRLTGLNGSVRPK